MKTSRVAAKVSAKLVNIRIPGEKYCNLDITIIVFKDWSGRVPTC